MQSCDAHDGDAVRYMSVRAGILAAHRTDSHGQRRQALQSCGIGTILIQAAEQRIRARGLHRAELGAEECNPRARALYERLGYLAYGHEPTSWDEEAPDGSLTRYEMVCTLLRKELP